MIKTNNEEIAEFQTYLEDRIRQHTEQLSRISDNQEKEIEETLLAEDRGILGKFLAIFHT